MCCYVTFPLLQELRALIPKLGQMRQSYNELLERNAVLSRKGQSSGHTFPVFVTYGIVFTSPSVTYLRAMHALI